MKIDPQIIAVIMAGIGGWITSYMSSKKSAKEIQEESAARKEKSAIGVLTRQVDDLNRRVDELSQVNQDLRDKTIRQLHEIEDLEEEKQSLLEQNYEYEKQIHNLEKRVEKLENELEEN